jgi:hypothetical protein
MPSRSTRVGSPLTTCGTGLFQITPAFATLMVPGPDRSSLSLVGSATTKATPGVFRQLPNHMIQRVMDRDRQTALIHLTHLSREILPVVGPAFQHIELPLMNHLMRQRVDQLIMGLLVQQRH